MSPETFFFLKGLIALITTVFVVIHMNWSWVDFDRDEDRIRTGIGQRMRYISWFLFIILIAGASAEQIHDGSLINPRNVAAIFVVSFATLTAIISIIEARRKRLRRH